MHHSAQHARGVLDRFATAQLHVVCVEKHHRAAQFADADLERHPRARRGLGENHRPSLGVERLGFTDTALGLDGACGVEDLSHRLARHAFQF